MITITQTKLRLTWLPPRFALNVLCLLTVILKTFSVTFFGTLLLTLSNYGIIQEQSLKREGLITILILSRHHIWCKFQIVDHKHSCQTQSNIFVQSKMWRQHLFRTYQVTGSFRNDWWSDSILPIARSEIATSWSPMHLKIFCLWPDFQY